MRCRSMRTNLACRSLKQIEPAIEMIPDQGQRQMRPHRLAVIAASGQHDRRPEIPELRKMLVPILHDAEDRPQQIILAHASVKFRDEFRDHRFCDPGALDDLLREQVPPRSRLLAIDL
jgi:hypothetical protein